MKSIYVVLLMLLCIGLYPVSTYASADDWTGGVMDGKAITIYNGVSSFLLTDGDLNTYFSVKTTKMYVYPGKIPITKFKLRYSSVKNAYSSAVEVFYTDGTKVSLARVNSTANLTSVVEQSWSLNVAKSVDHIVFNGSGGFEWHYYELNAWSVPDTTPPVKPTGLTGSSGSSSVTLNWTANTESDLSYYRIYKDGVYLDQSSAPHFEVNNLANGTSYDFTVSAVDKSGNESAQSEKISLTPTASVFEIENLKVLPDSSSAVTLTWNPVNSTYLKHYKVYQNDVLIGTVTQSTLAVSGLEEGQKLIFKVAAVDVNDIEYPPTVFRYTVPVPDTVPPQVPRNVRVTPDRYTAAVTWDVSPDTDILGYYIYLGDQRLNSSPVLTNFYTVTGLTFDTEYDVSVSAVDLSGNVSAQSAVSHFRTLTLKTIPATPSSLNANAFYKGANLSWLPSSSAEEYIIYMDGEQLFKTANTSAKVTNLVNGTDYDFAVSASNDIGESDLSNTVTVTPTESSPVDVTLGYSLKDISDGTANMFSAEWLLLAFCIAIPLSFYISNRIKGLINS